MAGREGMGRSTVWGSGSLYHSSVIKISNRIISSNTILPESS